MAAMFSTVCPTPHLQTNELNFPAAKHSITSAVTALKRKQQISAVLNTEKYPYKNDSKTVNGHDTITYNSNLVAKKAAPTTTLTPMFPPPLMKVAAESLQYESGLLGAVPAVTVAGDGGVHNAMSYLTRILSSKVYDVAIESPLDRAPKLSERLGVHVWLKREDLQPVFSFKLRGAYNMMAKLTSDQLAKGVICSSAGNHAQGVALSAKKLGCNAVIAMPVTTPEIKVRFWKTVERLGATVVLVGESYDETQSYAKQRAKDEGRIFIPPFDHPDVIAGQATVGMEIVRQMPGSLHAIFVPVGGGGLIAGIAAYVKRVRPEVKVIGVEPYDANAMALSLYHGQRIMLDKVGGFADGVAVKAVGEETFGLCRELIDGVVLVSRDAICASIKDMFEENRSILEPAGALAMAGAEAYCNYYGIKDENVVAITSGANMNFDRLGLVSQLADVGRRSEAVLATLVPEKWGNFIEFYKLVDPVNITEFRYRYDAHKDQALILYSVSFSTNFELEKLLDWMKLADLQTFNLTDNDLVKDHLQFLVGGRSNVKDEILCRFVVPERPGALGKFMDTFSVHWNITLFHYRDQGESKANVLVGFQVAPSEMGEFKSLADSLRWDYKFETDNEALQLLLH
ncbi:Threonine dehydratase 1 biosynthetic, chloroplastic [Linum perenne]